jgi:thioredoxin-like negative regulator of GroEL
MRTIGATSGRPDGGDVGPRAKALLVFFYSPTSGPSRRMDGLVSWLYVRERKRLRLRLVNVDVSAQTAERFRVSEVPTLLLLKGRAVVARLEGKVTGQQIDDAVLPHLRP